MRIDVMTFEGCLSGDATWNLVRSVNSELNVPFADVRRIEVTDPEAAERYRFLGSPSVHVNGEDIELARRSEDCYAITCRIYRSPDGTVSGLPPLTMLRAVIQEALDSEGNDVQK